jgi:ABC-type antimicrobial peptide transport system permease subunit
VLRQGAIPIAAGIVAGLALAMAGSRLAATFLRGVSAHDPLTYALVATTLAAVAFIATWIPARRAANIDPIRALRQD